MDVLREREMKDSLERQLMDEQKTRGEFSISVFRQKVNRLKKKKIFKKKEKMRVDSRNQISHNFCFYLYYFSPRSTGFSSAIPTRAFTYLFVFLFFLF